LFVKSSTIHLQANNDWVNIGVACVRDIGISYSHCCYCFGGFLVQSLIDIYIFFVNFAGSKSSSADGKLLYKAYVQ
jgi:hypothetical protein